MRDAKVHRLARLMGLGIALSGLILPFPIMVLADACSLGAAGCGFRARFELARTAPEVFFIWNLVLGWTHFGLGAAVYLRLRDMPGPGTFRASALAWSAILLTKTVGSLIGLVEQGFLVLPLITAALDIAVIAVFIGASRRARP